MQADVLNNFAPPLSAPDGKPAMPDDHAAEADKAAGSSGFANGKELAIHYYAVENGVDKNQVTWDMVENSELGPLHYIQSHGDLGAKKPAGQAFSKQLAKQNTWVAV